MKEKIHRITTCDYIADNLYYWHLYSREDDKWVTDPNQGRDCDIKKLDNDLRTEYVFITTNKQTIMIRKKKLTKDFSSFITRKHGGKNKNQNYGILESIEIGMGRDEDDDMEIRIMFNTTEMSFSVIYSSHGMSEIYIESNQLTTKFYA